jgi:oligoendopeptidase F
VALEAAVKLAGSWIKPELLALEAGKIQAFLAAAPGLGKFRFSLLNLLRQAPHTLNAEGEGLLALGLRPKNGIDCVLAGRNADSARGLFAQFTHRR